MARRVEIFLIDDADGCTADETVHFALDGRACEIDVPASNAAVLRSLLAPFIAAERRTTGTRGLARKPGAGGFPTTAAIRQRAIANGIRSAPAA